MAGSRMSGAPLYTRGFFHHGVRKGLLASTPSSDRISKMSGTILD